MPIEYSPALPDEAASGDPGHVTDHNSIRSALTAVQAWGNLLETRVAALEVNPPPPPPPPSGGGGLVGTGLSFDALGNTQIGGNDSGSANVYADFFFTAAYSSTLVGWRVYWLDENYPGYGGGNGGTFTVTLETDAGGVPSGTALATRTGVHVDTESVGMFPEFTFASPPSLTAGQKYHLVVKNTAASPTVDFSSWNMCWNADTPSPRNPRWANSEFGMLRKFVGGSYTADWGVDSSDHVYTPIIDLRYGNGYHQGNGYMEVQVGGRFVDGADRVRMRWTQQTAQTVSGAYFRLGKNSGGSGDVTYTLKHGSTTLGTVTVSGSSIPVLLDTNADGSTGDWLGGSFASNVALTVGTEYTLEVTGASGSLAWTRGIQSGHHTGYGFDLGTVFDGVGEYSTDSGSSWAQDAGLIPGGAYQFYMPVV